jgi:hypothetical protein
MTTIIDNLRRCILGYDARVISAAWKSLWNDERRHGFLINEDVEIPLSVDTLVWPSVFDWGQGPGLPQSERNRLLLSGLPVAEASVTKWPLWSDLSKMRTALSDPLDPAFLPFWIIAVGSADRDESVRPACMEFLGYDVGDSSLLSGITNCRYDEDELPKLRSTWASEFNASHLFNEWIAADRFRRLTDSRVPEHRPFLVYGIWKITPDEGLLGVRCFDSADGGEPRSALHKARKS